MTSLREALVAAIKSLLRGKSFIKAFLAIWAPTPPGSPVTPQNAAAAAAAGTPKAGADPAADFLAELEHMFLGYIEDGGLKRFSRKLKRQFKERLRSNPECMLPSYNSQLPTGQETGQYLALDVGGSTLRVALVDLRGRGSAGTESGIVQMDSFKIDSDVRNLKGTEFFDWMAERIHWTVAKDSSKGKKGQSPEDPLLVGLAWSFPIEYVSPPFSSFPPHLLSPSH